MTPEPKHHVETAAARTSWLYGLGLHGCPFACSSPCTSTKGLLENIIDSGTVIGRYVKDTKAEADSGGNRKDIVLPESKFEGNGSFLRVTPLPAS